MIGSINLSTPLRREGTSPSRASPQSPQDIGKSTEQQEKELPQHSQSCQSLNILVPPSTPKPEKLQHAEDPACAASSSGEDTPVTRFRRDATTIATKTTTTSFVPPPSASTMRTATTTNTTSALSTDVSAPLLPPATTTPTISNKDAVSPTRRDDENFQLRSVGSRLTTSTVWQEEGNEIHDPSQRSWFGQPRSLVSQSSSLSPSRGQTIPNHHQHHSAIHHEEETTSLLYVEQAREAIHALTDPSASRLSDDRIQQVLLAAMRFEMDHAPTVPVSSSSSTMPLPLTPPLQPTDTTALYHTPPRPPHEILGRRGDLESLSSPFSQKQGDEAMGQLSIDPNDWKTCTSRRHNETNDDHEHIPDNLLVTQQLDGSDDTGILEHNAGGAHDDSPLDRSSRYQLGPAASTAAATATALRTGHFQNHSSQNLHPGHERESSRGNNNQKYSSDGVPKMIELPSPPTSFRQQRSLRIPDTNVTLDGSGIEEEKKELSGKLITIGPDAASLPQYDKDAESLPTDTDPQQQTTALPPKDAGVVNGKYSDHEIRIMRSTSMTESDVGSMDGLPSGLQSTLLNDEDDDGRKRDQLLQKLDGVAIRSQPQGSPPNMVDHEESLEIVNTLSGSPTSSSTAMSPLSCFQSIGLNYCLWPDLYNIQEPGDLSMVGGNQDGRSIIASEEAKSRIRGGGSNASYSPGMLNLKPATSPKYYWNERADDAFDLFGNCSAMVNQRRQPQQEPVATSLVRVMGEMPPPSYAEAIRDKEIDPRLQSWVNAQFTLYDPPPYNGTYDLGRSRTVIVHEIARGDWTWCTAWSPNGDRLAVATENHHLAVIETTASTVWRVRHDRRLKGPAAGDTTHSIRSVAWGKSFLAAGGTGNAVSILSPLEPYPVLHMIKGTGFVGSLDWKDNSNVLAIGSRSKKLLIVRVRATGDQQVESEILYTAQFDNWVNRVAFSPSGRHLAAGNASGVLSVYNVQPVVQEKENNGNRSSPEDGEKKSCSSSTSSAGPEVTLLYEFELDDSILALDWSPDGRWLYAGGEDYHIAVIETTYWEMVHKIPRERWVQCIATSGSGTHVAVGGMSSEISLLDVRNGWDSVMGIELKGLVPLSASWHPKDQALALTGQNNSVLVVETTNARHVQGHHLHSVSPIMAVCFAPDGRTAVIGNEAGVVTFFSLSGSTFESTYELVVVLNERLSIDWSLNGRFAVIGSKDALIIVGPNMRSPSYAQHCHHCPSPTCGDGSARRRPLSADFSIQRVIRNIGETNAVAIDSRSRYVAVAGDRTRIFDASKAFSLAHSWKTGITYAVAWSPNSQFLACMGFGKVLSIYDTSDYRVKRWRSVFSLQCDFNGYALAWAPHIVGGGLVYLAYGGSSKMIYIMEIRTLENSWETVLRIPRDGQIRDLDWGSNGLLAAGIDNGTVSIIDLAYLLSSGVAVNEKDYNWQRQALTCYTEIRRNRGSNSIQAVRWMPSAPGSDSLIAVGGTDGEMEIVDLTERRRCRGYYAQKSSHKHPPTNNPRNGATASTTILSPPISPTTTTTTTATTGRKLDIHSDK